MAKAGILVVEDDQFYIDYYREVLEKDGFAVAVAHTGREALGRLERESFDLVIADLVLKNTSGLELLSQIKRSRPTLDVLMVTGMQSIRKAVDALKLGASDYLTKPIDREELMLAIHKILDRQVVSQEHSKLISENIHFYELQRIEKKNLALLATTDLEKLQESVLDVIIQELNAPGAVLFLREPERGRYPAAAYRGVFEVGREHIDLAFRSEGLREALEDGHPLMESLGGDQWVPKAGDEGQQIILPVRRGREIIGAVRVIARKGERPYGGFDVDLARHILDAGGLALKNAFSVRRLKELVLQGATPGTWNPHYFRSVCEAELSIARRYNREAAVLLLSLDNFDAIHRQFKETQVNRVLETISRHVLEVIRETDLLSRLEDDLFGVFVPETDYYGVLMLKKRIRARLARTVYSLDMKRDMLPIIHLGCAACPRDGATYPELVEVARTDLLDERKSVYGRLDILGKDIWGMVERLSQPGFIEKAAGEAGHAIQLTPVDLSLAAFQALSKTMLRDLSSFYTSRGIVYFGVGKVEAISPSFLDATPRDNVTVSLYALGARGEGLWNLPHITPVFIGDPHLAEWYFILGITEHFFYGLFCRRSDSERMAGFHTSDSLLVMELMTRLQEKYLLQRRIG